ncbi:MAG: DNA-formamidopyrimidine glycosylase family protein [Opitutus sp.]
MPELAEVEFFRKRWHLAAIGQRVTAVHVHPVAKIFRGTDVDAMAAALTGAKFLSSESAAKQMLFRFSGNSWLGIHLGMSGDLYVHPPAYVPQKHDHLVLAFKRQTLVLSDPRMFGRVLFHHETSAPDWWSRIAPSILSRDFTTKAVSDFLRRRARAPIKAVLLMQERFPGVGNWMADEILWRAEIHPKQSAGSLTELEINRLWKECRHVCALALEKIAGKGNSLPVDLNVNIPESWLFRHRWREGGRCPKTGALLMREEVGGRTTCWSPARQKLRVSRKRTAPKRKSRSPA